VMALFLVAAIVIRSSYGVLQWQTSRARRASPQLEPQWHMTA
jgi:hypothetical protein